MHTLNTLVPTMVKLVEADYWIKRWEAEYKDATMASAADPQDYMLNWAWGMMTTRKA